MSQDQIKGWSRSIFLRQHLRSMEKTLRTTDDLISKLQGGIDGAQLIIRSDEQEYAHPHLFLRTQRAVLLSMMKKAVHLSILLYLYVFSVAFLDVVMFGPLLYHFVNAVGAFLHRSGRQEILGVAAADRLALLVIFFGSIVFVLASRLIGFIRRETITAVSQITLAQFARHLLDTLGGIVFVATYAGIVLIILTNHPGWPYGIW